jgi:hypothetical protein
MLEWAGPTILNMGFSSQAIIGSASEQSKAGADDRSSRFSLSLSFFFLLDNNDDENDRVELWTLEGY